MLYVEDVVGDPQIGPDEDPRKGVGSRPTPNVAVIPLVARFPALARVPRVALGCYPTPVVALGTLAPSLWIKRDDLCADPMGGNKARALEFLFGDLEPGERVVTVGSAGSTHALAVAVYAKRLGARAMVGRWRQEMNATAIRVAQLLEESTERAPIFRSPIGAYLWAWRAQRRGARWIPAGGSTPLGILGHVNAGLELVAQIDAGLLPSPDRVVVPLGTGGGTRRSAHRWATASRAAPRASDRTAHRAAHRRDVATRAPTGCRDRTGRVRRRLRPRDGVRTHGGDAFAGSDVDRTRSDVQREGVRLGARPRVARIDAVLVNLRLPNPWAAMTTLPEVTFHIYPTDCDMLGHLNHATMLDFLERARWALLEPQIDVRHWAKQPVFSVVRHVDIGYLAQSRPGEDLVIRSGLLAIRRTSYIIKQEVRKVGSDSLVAEASIVFVAIDQQGLPVPVPESWRSMLPQWPESD
jgi:YbgC/YbaW family acyl-CoA thioester hydrolase